MPTTSFLAIEIYNQMFQWLSEPWCLENRHVYRMVTFLVEKLCNTIAKRDAIEENENLDPTYIHLHHQFDAQGNRLRFRRIDFLFAAIDWILHFSDTDCLVTYDAMLIVSPALDRVEYALDPTRTLEPAESMLLPGPVWTNGSS